MIQLCEKAIVEPLRILFLSFLEKGVYPDDWKKSNVVPIHNKESKNLLKNYRPISLLHVFSNVSERIIFNSLFNYFLENKLFTTKCQSGFLPGDSCISQLLSVTHEIYKSFDCNRSVDVSGSFFRHLKSLWQGLAWWFNLQTQVIWCRKQTSKPNSELFNKPPTTCSTQWAYVKMDLIS